jgi:hydroxypyruvate reductase
MAMGAMRCLDRRVARGLVTTLDESPSLAPLTTVKTEHPVAGAGSLAAGRRAVELAESAPARGCIVVLISGGASSMLSLPLPGLTVEDKARASLELMRAGADISALNAVRKHLSAIKGGRMAAVASGPMLALVISDVVGDDVSIIGSGPTVPDPTTFVDALRIVDRYAVADRLPRSVFAVLEQGARGLIPETPKSGSAVFQSVTTCLIGSVSDGIDGAAREARRLGYSVARLTDPVVGSAADAGARLVTTIRPMLAGLRRPACLLSGGETTVTVRGHGRGGRNQELALGAAQSIRDLGQAILASVGTDGIDGPTDAAGARVDRTTLERAASLGLADPSHWLDRNDSYAYFEALGDLIVTGPTGTNVGDVQVVLVAE